MEHKASTGTWILQGEFVLPTIMHIDIDNIAQMTHECTFILYLSSSMFLKISYRDGAIEFFTNRIKITCKWPVPNVPEYILGMEQEQLGESMQDGVSNATTDHANFAGRM